MLERSANGLEGESNGLERLANRVEPFSNGLERLADALDYCSDGLAQRSCAWDGFATSWVRLANILEPHVVHVQPSVAESLPA